MIDNVKVMGIVNVNSDSFFAESRSCGVDAVRKRIDHLLDLGVDIIDIGAVSSRPGATVVGVEEEWNRLEPVLDMIGREYAGCSFSIDTFRAAIVLQAYQIIGRFTVNDISAGQWDEAMLPVVGRLGLRYIAMHLQGTFETMHDTYCYDDVVESVVRYFEEFKERSSEAGIENWIVDPGFGFSKSDDDNMKLLMGLNRLRIFHRPILVGISNKRFTKGETKTLEDLAVSKGATIIRSHCN